MLCAPDPVAAEFDGRAAPTRPQSPRCLATASASRWATAWACAASSASTMTRTRARWDEFEVHFDKRKVELGQCGRPYATPCEQEHACIRCPMLHVDPVMLERLDEINADLISRRVRAEKAGSANSKGST
jgi:hypothetical protein